MYEKTALYSVIFTMASLARSYVIVKGFIIKCYFWID